mmetsp:Transcript_32896/g.53395  ORF Transcript_32896/g.53395 Transcript_32896/m.53395 type:complete len:83 (-) Transcript_32896:118-366(-)
MSNQSQSFNVKQSTMEVLFEMSQILNTGLSQKQLQIVTELCEMGVNPEALAKVIQQLKAKQMQQQQPQQQIPNKNDPRIHRK